MIKRIDLESIALIFVLLTICIGGVVLNIGYLDVVVMLCLVFTSNTVVDKLLGNSIINILGTGYIAIEFINIVNSDDGSRLNGVKMLVTSLVLMIMIYNTVRDRINICYIREEENSRHKEFYRDNWLYGDRYKLRNLYYGLMCALIFSMCVGFKLDIKEGIYLIPVCIISAIYRIMYYEHIYKIVICIGIVDIVANLINNEYYTCGIYSMICIYVIYSYMKMKGYCSLLEVARE